MSVAWSYSYLQAFETCPRRFYLTKIAKKVVEPQTAATIHGNEVHKAIENAVVGRAPLPEKYAQYGEMVNAVLAAPGTKHAEMKFGLTAKLTPTGFFAKDVWLRGVLDLAVVREKSAIVIDWKTGKPKTDGDQMALFAAASFSVFPNVATVKTGYAWLANNLLDTKTFKREDAEGIWNSFKPRVARINIAVETGDFPPRPSGLCKNWCPVGQANCEFCGK